VLFGDAEVGDNATGALLASGRAVRATLSESHLPVTDELEGKFYARIALGGFFGLKRQAVCGDENPRKTQ